MMRGEILSRMVTDKAMVCMFLRKVGVAFFLRNRVDFDVK